MKRILLFLLIAVVVLTTSITLAATTTKNPYTVGVFCSQSGPGAAVGISERDTLLMLTEQINSKGGINGHQLKLIIEDDGSDASVAVKIAKKLIDQDKVCAIIGGSGLNQTKAVISGVTEAGGVLHVSMAAGINITNPVQKWVFKTPPSDALAIEKVLTYLTKQKIEKIAMLYDSNVFGSSGHDELRNLAPKYKVSIVTEQPFNSKDTSMTVQLTKIKATDAQAIICWGAVPASVQIVKDVKKLEITLPLIMSPSAASGQFLEQAGVDASGIVLPSGRLIVANFLTGSDPQKKTLLDFGSQFQIKYNQTADANCGYAWDTLQMVVQVLKKTGDDRVKIRDEFEKIKKFTGISGIYTYSGTDHDGLTLDALVMLKVVDGKWSLVSSK